MINLYIIETVSNIIRSFMVIYFFDKVLANKRKYHSKISTIIMIIFYALVSSSYINRFIPNLQGYKMIIFIISYFIIILIYPVIFKNGRMAEKIFLSAFYISMMLASSFIIHSIYSGLCDVTLSNILLVISRNRSISILVTHIIQFIIIVKFSGYINFIKYIKDKNLYVGGVILVLNHVQLFVIERDLLKNSNKIDFNILMSVFILCLTQILAIYLLSTLAEEIEEKFILKMNLNRQIHDEEITYMYKEMNGWKHDLKNHIIMILGLLEMSTKENVISYIKEIDSSIDKIEQNLYTDNIAINSILISKMKVADEKNIKVNLEIIIDLEIKISNVDLCIILGNLLDNSIEACSHIDGYRYIDLKIISVDNKLVIKIINNTNGYVNEVNGRFLTTKDNPMSGIGLIQVDSIVTKYKGYVNRKHKNDVFITYLMIEYDV